MTQREQFEAWLDQRRADFPLQSPTLFEAWQAAQAAQAAMTPPESTLVALARRCLWIAYCWNDHNFEKPAHRYAQIEAEQHGIIDLDAANVWIAAAPQPKEQRLE
jgi:hypothetical protein